MTVSFNTIQSEGIGYFFQNLGKKGLNLSKKMVRRTECIRKDGKKCFEK